MADKYKPRKKDRFAFGIWSVLNRGRDPFGTETRPEMDPIDGIRGLARRGVYGFEFHDDDLVPFDASDKRRRKIIDAAKRAMKSTGILATAATTNLFTNPVFRDGAFTSHDPEVRAFAVRKVMRVIDLAAELETPIVLLWGGREGAEVDGAKDPVVALQRYRECIDFLCEYVTEQGHSVRLSIEAKPNEPRGDIYLATTGHVLGFIATLARPEMVGTNPEYAHVKMAGLNPYHEYAQALEAGKLFDVHMNGQKMGRFDQDMSLGADGLKEAFFVTKLLVDYGYKGTVAFDAHPFRTENDPWDFVVRCMRTYRMLVEKVEQLNADSEYRKLMKPLEAQRGKLATALREFGNKQIEAIRGFGYKPDVMARRKLPYERIDQIVNEVLLGVR